MNENENPGCGCGGDCSAPKKRNPIRMIIFAVIILAAAGILAVKLFSGNSKVPSEKQSCRQETTAGCDTTKASACDTTKNSSCCSK